MLGKEGTKQGMPRGAWRPGASPAMAFNTDSNILAEGADPEKALWVFLGGGRWSLCHWLGAVRRAPNSAVCRTILRLKEVSSTPVGEV